MIGGQGMNRNQQTFQPGGLGGLGQGGLGMGQQKPQGEKRD